MRILNKGVEIYRASFGDLYLTDTGTSIINTKFVFPKLLELFPDYEQIKQLNEKLLIVIGHGRDTILLDIVW